ncbi:unnamed protein product [Parajaminaea phylloscopi]
MDPGIPPSSAIPPSSSSTSSVRTPLQSHGQQARAGQPSTLPSLPESPLSSSVPPAQQTPIHQSHAASTSSTSQPLMTGADSQDSRPVSVIATAGSSTHPPSPALTGDEADRQSDQRSKVRFAGAVRRGGWRNVNSVAASRDHSDQSSGDEAQRPTRARPSGSSSTPLRRGQLVARGSTGNVPLSRASSSTKVRRASSKSLGDESSDSDESDEMSAKTPGEVFSQAIPDGEGAGLRKLISAQEAAVSCVPATLVQLPPIEHQRSDGPAAGQAAVAPAAAEIDWANFVYAYARGRWDPMRAPRPPGRSTAFPGASTSVVLPIETAPGSDADVLPPLGAGDGARRPSLNYDDVAVVGQAVQQLQNNTTQPPADHASTLPSTSHSALPEARQIQPDEERVKLDPALFRACSPMQTPQLQYDAETSAGPEELSGTREGAPSEGSMTEPALERLVSWSSPEFHSTVAQASRLEETKPLGTQISEQLRKVQRATHSTSEAIAGPSLTRTKFQEDIFADPMVWNSGKEQYPSPGHAANPSSKTSASARERSPSPDPTRLPEGSAPPRALQALTPQPDGDGASDQAQRPGPTPVQLSGSLDVLRAGDVPAVWQSAPEGLSMLPHMPGQSSDKDLDHDALLVSRAEESSTVAGLRRAARRSSLLRPDEPTPFSRSIGIHSNSWSSEPGPSSNLTIEGFSRSALATAVGGGIPTLASSSSRPMDLREQAIANSTSRSEGGSATGQGGSGIPTTEALADGASLGRDRSSSGTDATGPSDEQSPTSCSLLSALQNSQGDETSATADSLSISPKAKPPPLRQRACTTAASSNYLAAGKQAEQFYRQSGYLPAVNPPNEADRQRALARYGPPRITGDPNFDRIGHLVRLVFSSQIVLISLVGSDQQLFQTAVGGGAEFTQATLQKIAGAKHCSFCAHAILQPSDEPLVVLNTLTDWRFAGNPLVVGQPHIRFYAGCPLRTADGHNLGTLCLIDSEPRTEFSPRLRHTLKEFGRIVMRELELTRDRIHLTTRDRMQRSIELFTRDCLEMAAEADSTSATSTGDKGNSHGDTNHSTGNSSGANGSLHALYSSAAQNMHETLKVAGAVVFDLSHLEVIDSPGTTDEDGLPSNSKIFYPSPYSAPDVTPYASFDNPSKIQTINSSGGVPDEAIKGKAVPPMGILGVSESMAAPDGRDKAVPLSHHIKIAQFLRNHRTGYFYPMIPSVFRQLLPAGTSNMLLVPIFGLNKQPFALLCAYAAPSDDGMLLEDVKDSALQYMRSMGTIILSAVLKKDLMLADQAKSHFISNISHELRTPLHGILASSELLAETKLNTTQGSYLDTVEACGKSLLELVNHVLDFTKLSGNAMNKGGTPHALTPCDLIKLVQEVCESSWIGQTARKLDSQQSAGIGSAYAGGSSGFNASSASLDGTGGTSESLSRKFKTGSVETVIDVSMRPSGWLVNCDAGGIRRVLMNLIGNSLKFTTAGFVHVSLREVQSSSTHVVVELSVTDTGRGISKSFLEQQLFHPFTQENELGPGTGLGLSIVNSIVQSPSINGKIDVWSTLGEGTEMRITCEMALASADEIDGAVYQPAINVEKRRRVTMAGFDDSRGQVDLKQVLLNYLGHWWNFDLPQDDDDDTDCFDGDIVIINENVQLLEIIKERRKSLPPVIVLSSALGDSAIPEACEAYHAAGGVARMLFKPAGPAKLEAVVDFCLQCLDRTARGEPLEKAQTDPATPLPSPRPSPMHMAEMENSDSYFDGVAMSRTMSESPDSPSEGIENSTTPRGLMGDSVTPRPLSSAQSRAASGRPPKAPFFKEAHHVSPALWDSTPASLLRRHSDEEDILRMRSKDNGIFGKHKSKPLSPTAEAVSGTGGNAVGPVSSKGKAASRPLLPARSITFHQEPKLHKHMALSPSLLRESSAASGGDYFSAKPLHSAASNNDGQAVDGHESKGNATSSPSNKVNKSSVSPGSTVPIDGGEDRLLRSALGTVKDGSSKRVRVMGVDDNEINIKILAAFMAKFDVDFVPARNGQECVDLFERSSHGTTSSSASSSSSSTSTSTSTPTSSPPFDIIILDLTMPILDGHQATAVIRRKEAERAKAAGIPWREMPRVKIVCLTGRNSEEDRRKAFASGADGYLTRPLSLRSLSALMRLLTQ